MLPYQILVLRNMRNTGTAQGLCHKNISSSEKSNAGALLRKTQYVFKHVIQLHSAESVLKSQNNALSEKLTM